MKDEAKQLLNYLSNIKKAEELKKQISDLFTEIVKLDTEADQLEDTDTKLKQVCEEIYKKRIERIQKQLELNKIEKKILEFELAEELAE